MGFLYVVNSGGSRNFHKLGPSDYLRGGQFLSCFSDSIYNQPNFSKKRGILLRPSTPKSAAGKYTLNLPKREIFCLPYIIFFACWAYCPIQQIVSFTRHLCIQFEYPNLNVTDINRNLYYTCKFMLIWIVKL